MTAHKVTSREEWLAARRALLAKEKELTRQRDRLSEERRALPWVRVDKPYMFQGPGGRETLGELFAGRSQLAVYHFMLGPDWTEGCKSCSFWADNYAGIIPHLEQRDVTLVTISRAPLEKIEAFRRRMGWSFKWVSSLGNDFNADYGVSFTEEDKARGQVAYNYGTQRYFSSEGPGMSVFLKDASGAIYHTYSAYARGLDAVNVAYQVLDLTPKGRNEAGLPYPMAWVRHHDKYEESPPVG
jgi:predicted dithiol-disulfide oxidoreductase (DUF899 family)